MNLLIRVIIATLSGYILGSCQLAPLFLKAVGENDGTRASVAPKPGRKALTVAAVCFDVVKGLVVMPLAGMLLEGEIALVLVPAAALVVGHRYPVFFRFHGGSGVAPCTGLLLFSLIADVYAGGMYWHTPVIAVVTGVSLFISTRTFAVPGALMMFLITIMSVLAFSFTSLRVAIFAVLLFGFAVDSVGRNEYLQLPKGEDIKIWRIAARPFALLFILIDVIWDRPVTLYVLGSLSVIFVAMDLIRLFSKHSSAALFKPGEKNRFSSMTLFLVASAISFLVFPAGIPYVALICITIGDFCGKIVGMQYGTTYLYRHKTLEGTCAFFAGSIAVAYIIGMVLDIPLIWVVVGSAIASVTELFSDQIDDNFTVSIVTGGFLTAIRYIVG